MPSGPLTRAGSLITCAHSKSKSVPLIIGWVSFVQVSPSVEVASKIAEVFGVTIDYLIGKNHNMAVDKKTLKRMEDIDKLDNDTQEKLFFLIDNVVQNSKAKKAFAS